MKKKNFKVGDRVGINLSLKFRDEWDDNPQLVPLRHEEDEGATYGSVLEVKDKKAVVELDNWTDLADFLESSDDEEDTVVVDFKHLLLESEMKEKESQLEKDFKSLSKKLKEKVKQAADLLDEGQKMAKEQGRNLADMYDVYGPLYRAMDKAGWRTSSFGC